MRALLRGASVVAFAILGATSADAQPAKRPVDRSEKPPVPPPAGPTNLRSHIGTDHAARLIRDPETRIRGIQRAAAIGTPEAVALLVDAVERTKSDRSADTRTLLAFARALGRFADQERARAGLLAILGANDPVRTVGSGPGEEGDLVARAELAREVAAIALARSGVDRALELLYGAARGGGNGKTAALVALGMYPPKEPGFYGTAAASLPVAVVRFLGRLGDLRALDTLHGAARASDVNVRAAALLSLAELGDERTIPLARAAIAESDVRLRAASGEAFILLAAPERFKATAAIIADEATTAIGLPMAERVHNAEITKLVAARAFEHPDREIRAAAIRALGRSPDPDAAKALVAPQILVDPELGFLAIAALARSPAPNGGPLIGGLLRTRLASLAVRAYVVRALVRGERLGSSDDDVAKLASSRVPADRALGIFAQIALGEADVATYLDDKDVRVRRAAAMGSLASRSDPRRDHALLGRYAREDDAITRQALAVGLAGGDPEGMMKTSVLVDRAESGGGDAALATFALARRVDDSTARKVGQLLASKDAVLRAHAARGLAFATLPDATGRLADAYAWETDVDVRRAIVGSLGARAADALAPARKTTLETAADLDPDGAVRQAARRALAGIAVPFAPSTVSEVAWLRLTLEGGAPPGEAYAGSVVRSDGIAIPVVFDEEGFAVVPGLPPGEVRLVLAPRLPAYTESKKP